MDNNPKKIFEFSDPRQERIHKKLLEIGAGPAAFFKDACRMFDGEPPLESSSHLIAHCLREIESSVRDVMLPLSYKPIKGSKQTQRDEILAILASYKINPDDDVSKLWLRIASKQEEIALHHLAHRNSLDRPRQKDTNFEELWIGMQDLLDVLLNKMEANYVGYIGTLDGLLSKTTIDSGDLKILKDKIPSSPVTYNHFFGKLNNPDWLTPLKDDGFFSSPPPAFEHPDGGTSYPFWSQGEYLKKMAKIAGKQQEVLDICLAVETNNIRVKNDLLDVALQLPIEMAVQIVKKIDQIDYFISPDNYGKLIVYLSTNGKVTEAVDLAKKVLAFAPDPRTPPEIDGEIWHYDPVTVVRDHDYEEITEKNFPEFVDAAGSEAIKVLFDELESFHNLKYAGRKSAPEEDYSTIWRSAIEEHPENHKYGVRDILVTAMRDSSERFVTSHPEKLSELITELESRKHSIFRRLKLHLLRKFPQGSEKKIISELLNKEEFGDENYITHEYFLLAQEQAKLLTPTNQKKLLTIIETGGEYDKTTFEEICKQRGIEPTEEVAKKHKMVWQSYHLAPFKNVEPYIKKFYEDLIAETGEPESPDIRVRSSGGSWGFESTISDDEFKKKLPSDIVSALKEFKPEDQEQSLHKTREGTGRALVAQISEDPAKWSETIPSFSELDPTFTRSLLSGHREALKQGKTFEWKPLLGLGLEILKKPIEIKDRKSSGFYGDDPNWSWCRHTLVELVDDGLTSSSNPLPMALRKQAWEIIENLTRDPSPTPEEAVKLIENNEDPITAAINSTRGDAVVAAIQYGLWLKSSIPKEVQATWSIEKNAPELKTILEQKLDITEEPFLGIRAVFGQRLGNLAWMDIKWLEKILPLLFPDDPEKKLYFDAVWETFISFNPPYDDLLPLLSKQYARAVKEIGQHSAHKHRLENPDEMLAHNLLQFYFRGKIPLDSGLLKEFYDTAPIDVKSTIISFVGRNFKKEKVSDKIIERVKALAEYRIGVIKMVSKPHEEVQEFKEFSWWVSADCFDTKWAIDLLIEALKLGCDLDGDHLVIEKYQSIASTFPLEVVTSLELMVENDKKGWGVPTWNEDLRNVIKLVLHSEDEVAITKAKEFVNKLVAKGHSQYKDLID